MSNRNEAIRNGLLQYVGALMAETNREGAEAAHVALAQLSEVWLEASKTTDGKHYDTFKTKPILRAAVLIIEDYIRKIKEQFRPYEDMPPAVQMRLAEYSMAVKQINEIIDATKGNLDADHG